MKTFRTLLIIAIAILGFTANSSAQTNTATANATAKIIKPITIATDGNLVFGAIAASTGGGTVVLGTDGSRTPTGVALGSGTGVRAAAFTVTGDVNATYSVTLPTDSEVTLTSATITGETPMTVTGFTKSTAGILNGSGTQSFSVGATLTVNADQAQANDYTGTFNVTVNYN